jgi:predicted DCC family thiol-disulfide oxidoreductase YuxK
LPDERAIWSAAAADVEEASLVLAAVGIPHRVERAAFRWRLVVADADAERAAAALAAYEVERRRAPSAVPDERGAAWSGVVVAVLLLAFHALAGRRWMDAGAAMAGRIRAGEVWRTVTALTLHADGPHVLSNAVACVVFVTAVARLLGPGVGGWLIPSPARAGTR